MSRLIKTTQKTILEICKKNDQMDFYKALVNYLEFLTEERSEEEKMRMASSLIESFKDYDQ